MSIKKQRIRVIYRHAGLLLTVLLQCYGFRTGMWPAIVVGVILAMFTPGFARQTFVSRMQSIAKHKNAYMISAFIQNAALLFAIMMNMNLTLTEEAVEAVGKNVVYMPLPMQMHYVISHGIIAGEGAAKAVALSVMSTLLLVVFAGTDMYWYLLGLKEFPSEGDTNA